MTAISSATEAVENIARMQREYKTAQSRQAGTMQQFVHSGTKALEQGKSVDIYAMGNPNTMLANLVITNADTNRLRMLKILPIFVNGNCGWRLYYKILDETTTETWNVQFAIVANQEFTIG